MATCHHIPLINPATTQTVNTGEISAAPLGDNTLSLPALIAYTAILNNENITEYCAVRGVTHNLPLALFELSHHGHITVMWETVYSPHAQEELQ